METITPTIANKSMGMLAIAFHGELGDFQSPLPCTQALAQLQELIKWHPDRPSLTGSVSTDNIELYVSRTFRYGNGTRFQGRLLARGDGSSLVGLFRSSSSSRFFMTIGLMFVAFMLLGGIIGGLHSAFTQSSSLFGTLMHIAFLLLWLVGVSLMGWLTVWNGSPARGDIVAVSAAIQQALQLREHGA